jgi:hypothetical protein
MSRHVASPPRVMSCHVVSCRVMSCHVVSYHVMSYHVALFAFFTHFAPFYSFRSTNNNNFTKITIIAPTMSCHVASCRPPPRVMSCHVVSCRVMSCHVVSYHVMSYHVALFAFLYRRIPQYIRTPVYIGIPYI